MSTTVELRPYQLAGWRVRKYLNSVERLADVLRTERGNMHLTRDELATAAQVTASQITDLETGNATTVSLSEAMRIFTALKVRVLAYPSELL